MNNLGPLLQYLRDNNVKALPKPYQSSEEPETQMEQLFLRMAELGSDEDPKLQLEFFGKGQKANANYRKAKSRLYQQMLNAVLIATPERAQISGIDKAYLQALRHMMAGYIISMYSNPHHGILYFKECLKLSQKFELSVPAYLSSQQLSGYYGQNLMNAKEFKRYHKIEQQTLNDVVTENKLSSIYSEIYSVLEHKMISYDNKQLLKEKFEETKSLKGKSKTARSTRFYYNILAVISYFEKDYQQTITICNQAIERLKKYPYKLDFHIFTFQLKRLMALIQIESWKTAIELCTYYKITRISDQTTFIAQYYLFIIYMRTGKYDLAREVLRDEMGPLLEKMKQPIYDENFQIFNTYIQFLEQRGILDATQKRFRIQRFLNDVPTYSKDKQGLNSSVLILQILFFLHQKNYSSIIDRVDALKQYSYRYLRKDETLRTNLFIKMLNNLVRADFNRIRTERYVEPMWEQLQSVPINISEQGIEVEILPFEQLWPMVLEMLD